jgi:hypothetical protein
MSLGHMLVIVSLDAYPTCCAFKHFMLVPCLISECQTDALTTSNAEAEVSSGTPKQRFIERLLPAHHTSTRSE